MSIIGYHKANNYIITIETDNYKTYLREEQIKDFDLALYETKSFIVIDIEDLSGEHYDAILDFIIDEAYNYTNLVLEFYKIKELAFHSEFVFKQQWNFFSDGYAGYYKEYLNDGTVVIEYYHINGIKNGECKYYWNNGQLNETCFYLNGIKNGEYKSFYMNGKLKKKGYYVDNILQGDYYEYDDKGNIIKYLHV
jgi:antitoxin component YwqK of YwqJK toxin-antitoxin module